ncbi:MAG TPA: cytochrome c oxidase subunit II [Pseudonocardia sp.]|uniref:aa3-type cytochrome oxidase subunit II n=1 Tax=Pseudonocardia sp. TaxID=60912 RepID=UPI002B4B7049|nr:cytochrome c oxidase subunit II [Pseudonocardia sp.]HLU59611.1 cytochrome c oxidase subunit II [Pseudonocardia sp.]
MRRAGKLAGLALLVVPLTTGCSVEEVLRFGWPEGVTPQAESMRQLWTWSAVAALVVGAVTWGAMFWAVIFHRKRKGDDSLPRQTQYNLPLEITFTVIPTIIVAVLFAGTVAVQNYVDTDGAEPDVRVDVTAFQWNWEFEYPDATTPDGRPVSTLGTSDTIPLLVLPTNRRIEFTQVSNDVIHSFFVPEFLFKRDVFPMPETNDQDNVWQIDSIDREGAFVGRCAELCGTYHAMMNFEVRAISPELFDQWLALRQQVNPDTGAPYTAGEALQQLGCGQLCTPEAYTTYPFNTDRTLRSASQPVTAGS